MKGIVFGILLVAVIGWPVYYLVAYNIPADVTYARAFDSPMEMALDYADFEQMRDGVMQVWNTMNQTWSGEDYTQIYSSWWGPDQTFVNSMAAQNRYFEGLIKRLNETIIEKQLIQSRNITIMIPYSQWEQQTLQSFRNESLRTGGPLWVVRDAWYMRYAGLVAFWPLYFLLLEILLVIALIITLAYTASY